MRIVLATGNRDKVKEIEAIMSVIDVTLVRPDEFEGIPEVIEDGATLEDNALKKARVIREFTGMSALADDTGLEVDALAGAPGVYSSRYAGENATYDDNNRKLLAELAGVPLERRTARFRCVMALALVNSDARALYTGTGPDTGGAVASGKNTTDALITEGILHGRITLEKRGTSGFGFDPVFEVPSMGQTLAEMGLDAKNEISHRYRALVEMRSLLIRYHLAGERRHD
jgi:XTP/dITP diphosphohydrolase